MIKICNNFTNQTNYIGEINGTQGICSSYGRKYLDIG